MNNKTFFIALIISLFFHLWVMNIFLLPFDMKEDQLNKEKSVLSTRMTFFHSNSFFQPTGEIVDTSFLEDREMADNILSKDMTIGQKKTLVENVKEEIVKEVEGRLPVIKEMTEQQEAIEKKKNEKIKEEEHIDQEKEVTVSPEKREMKSIQPLKKPEQSKEKSQNNEKMQQLDSNEENKEVTEKPPLDLTQSDFSDSQVIPPKIVSFYPPDYPENLRKREIEGHVQLRVLIDKEGKAIQVEIDNSSGYQAFDQAAMQSVHRWQFKPAQFGNKERESWVLIPVVFQLE